MGYSWVTKQSNFLSKKKKQNKVQRESHSITTSLPSSLNSSLFYPNLVVLLHFYPSFLNYSNLSIHQNISDSYTEALLY
jgi:hypothetical protein